MRTKEQKQAVPPTPTSIGPDVGPRSHGPQRPPHRQVDPSPAGRLGFVGLHRQPGFDDPNADAGTPTLADERVSLCEHRL